MNDFLIDVLSQLKSNIYYKECLMKTGCTLNNIQSLNAEKSSLIESIPNIFLAEHNLSKHCLYDEQDEIIIRKINTILSSLCVHEFNTDIIEDPKTGNEQTICYCIHCEINKHEIIS